MLGYKNVAHILYLVKVKKKVNFKSINLRRSKSSNFSLSYTTLSFFQAIVLDSILCFKGCILINLYQRNNFLKALSDLLVRCFPRKQD